MSNLIPPDSEADLRAVENALSSLSPSRSGVDRDRLMFEAGRRSARTRWAWPSATAALAFLALGEAALLTTRATPEPQVIERIVEVKVPTPDTAVPVVILRQNRQADESSSPSFLFAPGAESGPLANQDYYHLREQALRFGVDSLPASPPLASRTDPGQGDDSFRSEIRSLLDPGETL